MRGRRRTLASALADALATRRGAEQVVLAAAFAEALGPRLAREASLRGVLRDGRLLVLSTKAWADQVSALGDVICARINARVGREVARGLHVRIRGPEA